jgi:peptidoglycan L-alanyl-D-glutamate endopeptidase CwlK
MASRSLKDLVPSARLKAEEFVELCSKNNIDVLIYCTLRTYKEQEELYEIGRKKSGSIVTNARGGYSWHNFGRAWDFVPLLSGKPQWSNSAIYRTCGILAESIGLEWAGRWTGSLKETAHIQYREGRSLEQERKERNEKVAK